MARVPVDLEGREAGYRGKRRGSGRQMAVCARLSAQSGTKPERPRRL